MGGEVRVFAPVPGHVVEGVPARRQAAVEVAGDVGRLEDVVPLHAARARQEVIGGGGGIGVDIVEEPVLAGVRALLGERVGRPDQLARLLGGQVSDMGAVAVVPPIGLGIGVPSGPDRVPRGIAGRRHAADREEGIVLLHAFERGDRVVVVRVGDGDDAEPVARIVDRGDRLERGAHRRLQFVEHGVEEDDERLAAGHLGARAHVDAVDRQAEDVPLDRVGAEVEQLGGDEEDDQHPRDVRVHGPSPFPCYPPVKSTVGTRSTVRRSVASSVAPISTDQLMLERSVTR